MCGSEGGRANGGVAALGTAVAHQAGGGDLLTIPCRMDPTGRSAPEDPILLFGGNLTNDGQLVPLDPS